ncbi:MFS transporter [Novosphingobium lentum]|uniref:MFS transporter n=1 Tax=Novosphingobium lentum TaxID=145287 RepID=UPI00082F05AE|nr:MFS transporter [Novosphingobium lentum]
MASDPRALIDERPMSRLQVAAVAITIGLNALDGFDVLSISFASPGISSEWGIDRAVLGAVLSAELVGMALGSVVLGGVADRIGRRPTILGSLLVMALGMSMATTAHGVSTLAIWRVVTGLGIGGMLAAINAVAAEFSNARRRSVAMALMVIGYPLGAVIGGSISALLLKGGDWRTVFEFGAIATLCFIPLVWLFVPESPAWLGTRRPDGAVAKINATFARFGHAPIEALAPPAPGTAKLSIADVLKPGLAGTTLLLTLAYFAHVISFYFILKWTPKIVVDMGFAPASAAGVLVWANLGGAIGGAIFGLVALRTGLKPLTIAVLLGSFVMVAWFGRGQPDLHSLSTIVFIAGLFTNSAIVGLYSIFALAFPTHVRATGTGFAIGVGRGGSALAPFLAGVLFKDGFSLQTVALLMAAGSLVAAGAITMVRLPRTLAA